MSCEYRQTAAADRHALTFRNTQPFGLFFAICIYCAMTVFELNIGSHFQAI